MSKGEQPCGIDEDRDERLSLPKSLLQGIQDAIDMGFTARELNIRLKPIIDCIYFDKRMDTYRRQQDLETRADTRRRRLRGENL